MGDMKLALVKSQGLSALNLAISGLMLLTFMTIHLFQFRFGDTEQFGPYYVRPPPYLINFWGILSLNLFWTDDTSVKPVGVRDIYALEFQIFKNPLWSLFYIFSVCVFMTHYCIGWKKVTPVLGIPKGHIKKVEIIGYAIGIVMGRLHLFPSVCHADHSICRLRDKHTESWPCWCLNQRHARVRLSLKFLFE